MRRRKQKKHWFVPTVLVLFLLLLLLRGISLNAPSFSRTLEEKGRTLLSEVRDFFSMEPKKVRALRHMEVAPREEGRLEYYFGVLNENEQRWYREMLQGFRSRENEFYLTTADSEAISRVYEAVLNDHPEIYWVRNHERAATYYHEGDDYCVFSPGNSYTPEEMAEVDESLERGFSEISAQISPYDSDYEKARKVYTYLIDQTEYEQSDHDQNIAGVFWQKKAVCAGYAAAMQYLMERLGMRCIYVSGDAKGADSGHAWDIIELDGIYYYADPTNGDQPEFLMGDASSQEWHKTTLYDYLCPFPEEYELTYTPSPDFPVPPCFARDKNFYVLNQACFYDYDWESVYNLCQMRINNEAAVVRFKFATEEAFQEAYADWVEGDSPGVVAQYYMMFNGLMEVDYHRGVLRDFKTIYYIF